MFEIRITNRSNFLKIRIGENRLLQFNTPTGFRRFRYEIGFGANIGVALVDIALPRRYSGVYVVVKREWDSV